MAKILTKGQMMARIESDTPTIVWEEVRYEEFDEYVCEIEPFMAWGGYLSNYAMTTTKDEFKSMELGFDVRYWDGEPTEREREAATWWIR